MGSKTTFPSTGEFPGFQPSTLPCLESWYPRFLLGGSSQFVLVDPSTCFPRPRDKTLESPRTPGALHALYRQPEALMSSPQKWQEVEHQKKLKQSFQLFFLHQDFFGETWFLEGLIVLEYSEMVFGHGYTWYPKQPFFNGCLVKQAFFM